MVFQRVEDALLEVREARLELGDQRFGARALGVGSVLAAVLEGGDAEAVQLVPDLEFAEIDHGADQPHLGAVVPEFGLEAAEASVAQQIHQAGFDDVVEIVPERQLVAAGLLGGGVEDAAAQVGAEAAGRFFPLDVEDVFDRVGDHVQRHFQRVAEILQRRGVPCAVGHVDAESLQVVFDRAVGLDEFEDVEQQQAVLAAGNADGDAVAGRDHVVPVNGSSRQPADFRADPQRSGATFSFDFVHGNSPPCAGQKILAYIF